MAAQETRRFNGEASPKSKAPIERRAQTPGALFACSAQDGDRYEINIKIKG